MQEEPCSICYGDMAGSSQKGRAGELVWCKQGCGHNVHARCLHVWAKHQVRLSWSVLPCTGNLFSPPPDMPCVAGWYHVNCGHNLQQVACTCCLCIRCDNSSVTAEPLHACSAPITERAGIKSTVGTSPSCCLYVGFRCNSAEGSWTAWGACSAPYWHAC